MPKRALFLTNGKDNPGCRKYTKVTDERFFAHAIESESKAMEKTLQVDPKGLELILA